MESDLHIRGEEETGGLTKQASGTDGEDNREPMLTDLTGTIQALMGSWRPDTCRKWKKLRGKNRLKPYSSYSECCSTRFRPTK